MRVQKSICDIKHVNIGISKNKLEKWKIVDYFLMQPKLNSYILECYIRKQILIFLSMSGVSGYFRFFYFSVSWNLKQSSELNRKFSLEA